MFGMSAPGKSFFQRFFAVSMVLQALPAVSALVRLRASKTSGTVRLARMPRIVTTMTDSMRVKPEFLKFIGRNLWSGDILR